jgi:hypothetical protein
MGRFATLLSLGIIVLAVAAPVARADIYWVINEKTVHVGGFITGYGNASGMRVTCGAIAGVFAGAAYGGSGHPLTVPGVQAALVHNGFPARTQCGEVIEPPPAPGSHSHSVSARLIAACWVVVERDGYSVQVIPHSNTAAAKLAYERTHNSWAKRSREAVIGHVVLTGYRITAADWLRVSHIVASVVTGSHP